MSKFLDGEGLQQVKEDYENKIGKKVDTVPGKSLVSDEEITKLEGVEAGAQKNVIGEVQLNTVKIEPAEGVVNIDLKDYTKTADLAEAPGLTDKFLDKDTASSTYLSQQDATSTYAKKEDLGKIQIPNCTKSDLESKKETAQDGERYTVTDDDFHIYIYDASSQEFKDTGTHVNLTDYAKTADLPTAMTQEEIAAILNPEA